MLKYAKIIDENNKECSVGTGTNEQYYISIGMELMNVEQSYNDRWYIQGFAPQKPIDELQKEIRATRNSYLEKYDFTQLSDAPFTEEEKQKYANYRQYLRNYTEQPEWWKEYPKTFDEWSK